MSSIAKFATAAVAAITFSAFAASSQAAVLIGLSNAAVDGGAINTVAVGANGAVFFGPYGTFEMELITGVDGIYPSLIGSTTNDVNTTGDGGELDIFITHDDILGPIPSLFTSSFTQNVLPMGWTVTHRSYVSATNETFTGTLLASHDFSEIGTYVEGNGFMGGGAGPYSVTTRITLNATSTGNAQSTLAIHAAVPEPATWGLMILGFGGAGVMLRSQRRKLFASA